MSEQVLNQFHSDKTLREDCIAIYKAMGLDLDTAFYSAFDRNNQIKICKKAVLWILLSLFLYEPVRISDRLGFSSS